MPLAGAVPVTVSPVDICIPLFVTAIQLRLPRDIFNQLRFYLYLVTWGLCLDLVLPAVVTFFSLLSHVCIFFFRSVCVLLSLYRSPHVSRASGTSWGFSFRTVTRPQSSVPFFCFLCQLLSPLLSPSVPFDFFLLGSSPCPNFPPILSFPFIEFCSASVCFCSPWESSHDSGGGVFCVICCTKFNPLETRPLRY